MEYQDYIIRRGDTLWGLAKKYMGSGIKYKDLAEINNIDNPDLIFAGDTLKIPTVKKKTTPPPPSIQTIYQNRKQRTTKRQILDSDHKHVNNLRTLRLTVVGCQI